MIVLDTHAWVWWVSNPEHLSTRAQSEIEKAIAEKTVYISAISAWEIAVLAKKGRLQLTMDVADWIARTEALPFVQFVPVNNLIAVRSVNLPGHFHGDPADRIIIATTITMGGMLITKDRKIHDYSYVKKIW